MAAGRQVSLDVGAPRLAAVPPPPAPRTAAAGARGAETLAAVEDLLAQRLDRLAREWHRGTATADVVLREDDVPELLARLTLGRGKRLRPLLCHWGWVAAGGPGADGSGAVVRIGAALELLHVFALVQDDVMDRSATRRGSPSLHVVAQERHRAAAGHDDPVRYGDSIAVLAGDLGHAEADALVAGLPDAVRQLWWRTCVELVRGQVRDLSGAATSRSGVSLPRAWEVARAKSGAYTVQRPLELGATVAGASAEAMELLGAYGVALGDAFALRDDLLGVWGRPELTGKPVFDDLRSGKATVLLALADQRLTGTARRSLARVRGQVHDEADVDVLQQAMVDQGVCAEVESLIERRAAEALDALDPRVLTREGVEGLAEVTTQVAWRSS